MENNPSVITAIPMWVIPLSANKHFTLIWFIAPKVPTNIDPKAHHKIILEFRLSSTKKPTTLIFGSVPITVMAQLVHASQISGTHK